MSINLELIDEKRESARRSLALYRDKMKRAYNRRVHERLLFPGDLVLRKAVATGKDKIHGKLSARWEGPYLIKEALGKNTFVLEDPSGCTLPSHWNTDQLKKYFA